jgi:hypothetical protein
VARRASIEPGDRFHGRTVIEKIKNGKHPRYVVRCDCGRVYQMASGTLFGAKSCRACGTERGALALRKYDLPTAKDPLYTKWVQMRHRCNFASADNKHWNGKGITVYPAWESFLVFREWAMANGYQKGLTLDRVNPDKNYEPSNCEWVTKSENCKRARQPWRREHPILIEMFWGLC